MRSLRALELGVVPTFRLFTGVRLAFTCFGFVLRLLGLIGFGSTTHQYRVSMSVLSPADLLDSGLLFLYLSLPGLQRRLKSFYLPIGIIWAVIGPILSQQVTLQVVPLSNPSMVAIQLMFWQLMPVLFIPLVVVAWQYSLREIALFCVLTTLATVAPLMPLAKNFGFLPLASLYGTAIIQAVGYLLVGNMILNMMRIQREQRARLAETNQSLSRYAATLEQLTVSRERNRLARELHDVLAHTLSGVAVEMEGVRTTLRSEPEQAEVLLNHSLQAVREGLTETRRALQELRAQPLEDLGLALAVRNLAESAAGRAGFAIEVQIDETLGEYPPGVEQCIYRVAQEALANVVDHAQAQHVQVRLGQQDGKICLIITDDGCGFDPNTPQLPEPYSYGIQGMRERVQMIGGDLFVDSQPGKGTRVVLSYGGNA